jgi:hypothetical protein
MLKKSPQLPYEMRHSQRPMKRWYEELSLDRKQHLALDLSRGLSILAPEDRIDTVPKVPCSFMKKT